MTDDHGYDGNYINSIIDLTGSEEESNSHYYNGLNAWWIDYYNYTQKNGI